MSSWQVGLYTAAVLIPLVAFAVELIFIRYLGRLNAYIATGAIGLSFLLSLIGFLDYFLIEAHGVFGPTTRPMSRPRPSREPSTQPTRLPNPTIRSPGKGASTGSRSATRGDRY